jgi:hypothetical protein
MTYTQFSTDELRGTTQADYLVSIEGDLRITDDRDYVYDEPSFPVAELARSLLVWLAGPDRADFEFDSMTFEEVGAVAVRRSEGGWVFSSVFSPGSASAPVDWAEAERCIRSFIAQVEDDLRGLGVDPEEVMR